MAAKVHPVVWIGVAVLATIGFVQFAKSEAARLGPQTAETRWPEVRRSDYGRAWPFTVDGGTIQCDRESLRSARLFVTLDTGDGIHYGLNGSAKSFGFPDGDSITLPGGDVTPFIQKGLELCR